MALIKIIALIITIALPQIEAAGQVKAIRFGTLVDGKGGVINDAVVLVLGNRIQRVGIGDSAVPVDTEVEIIDLRPLTGIPGLIDVHTHLTYGPSPGRGRLAAESMFLGQEAAIKTLESGVTTVRDMNASQYTDIAMRRLIKNGHMVGPRMFVVGYGLSVTRSSTGVPSIRTADSAAEIRRIVRRNIAAGVDWIKVFGSTGSGQDVTGFQTFTFEEMKVAVDTTHALGRPIAIHSYGPEGAQAAVKAGADSLEHATDLYDETIAEMVRRGTFYVPSIDHNRYYLENGEYLGYATGYKERLSNFIERNLDTARRAHAAGVRFAMGSDAIYTMFGENTRELEWFVKAGMTPEEALETATKNGAEMLRMEDEIGAVASGYYADMVAVDGDPLKNINAILTGVRWVMKDGEVVVDKIK